MLRITPRPRDGFETLVVEGRLVGPWVAELRRAAEETLERSGRLELHLAGVRFAGPEGASLLRELVSRGASVLQSSHFVDALLRPEPR